MINQLKRTKMFWLLILLMVSCATRSIDVKTPDFASIPDGTYRGYFDGGLVKATVDALMASGRIENVTIVSHKCGKGKPAEVIVNEVVRRQKLEVDAVSGATRSSKVILKAIEVALTR
jgi:uncharacterized protein with FMN-binding domain